MRRGAPVPSIAPAAIAMVVLCKQFGAAQPALRQPIPDVLILAAASRLGHDFAFRGKSQEPVIGIHWQPSSLLFISACLMRHVWLSNPLLRKMFPTP
jgi:hypothetical protein